MINKKKVLNAVIVLEDFLDSVPGGESYWIDDEGKEHTADLGYVNEFLIDLKEYTIDAWEEPTPFPDDSYDYKVWISYKFVPLPPQCIRCKSYHFDDTQDAIVLENIDNGMQTISIPHDRILIITVIDAKTNNTVYLYPPSAHTGCCQEN